MSFSARVLCDSVSVNGSRLTTVEMTYPRIIHSEHTRHRAFSFNVASSRAIPVERMMAGVEEDPFIPIHWGLAQGGMQAFEQIPRDLQAKATGIILRMRDQNLTGCRELLDLGLHKQVVNRYLEPWMWCTVICSGTDRGWRHFDSLRCHEMAEPHIRFIAELTRDVRNLSTPVQLAEGGLHLPLFGFPGDELITEDINKLRVSAGRCARVSYETHMGIREIEKDFGLADRLIDSRHWSPTEHPAISCQPRGIVRRVIRAAIHRDRRWLKDTSASGGNFGPGWIQFRKTFAGEFTA